MGYYDGPREKHEAQQYQGLPTDVQRELQKNNPRREVTQQDYCGSNYISDLFADAERLAKQWGKSVEDVSIEAESEYDSTHVTLFLTVQGTETDQQYYSRLWRVHEQTLVREKYERQEFERLSAKFAKK